MPDENLDNQVQQEKTISAPSFGNSKKWIKAALFGIIGIVITVGLVYAGYWYGIRSAKLKPQIPASPAGGSKLPTEPQTQPILTPTRAPVTDPTVNWKTYTNTKHGYLVSYPPNWLTLSPGGQYGDKCIDSTDRDDIIELVQKTLNYCGFVGDQLPNSDAEFTIWVLDRPWEKEEVLTTDAMGKDISQDIVVAGEKATKTPFTEKSELPNIQATRIYFNHNSKGYLMFLKQTDKKGSYDLVYDQILSTFQFLD